MGIDFVESNKNLTDNEIVESVKNGNYELLGVIFNRYYPTVEFFVNKYCPVQYREDAFQEAVTALYCAIREFDGERSQFSTFASVCIKRSVISVLRNLNRQKRIPDELITSIENEEIIDRNTPETIFFDKEDYKCLTDSIKLELSTMEYGVLELYLEGKSYSEIASRLSVNEKSVGNALLRIRKKLKK